MTRFGELTVPLAMHKQVNEHLQHAVHPVALFTAPASTYASMQFHEDHHAWCQVLALFMYENLTYVDQMLSKIL